MATNSFSGNPVAQVGQEGVDAARLRWVGPLTIAVAVIGNLIVRTLGVNLFAIPDTFLALNVPPTILFTLVGVLGAIGVFAWLGRRSPRPISRFTRVAAVVLVVSLVPDLGLLAAPMPGSSLAAVGVLMVEHIVAAAASVGLLTTLARSR